MLHGETTALLPGDDDVLMFSMTSGTTGEPKYIPVTRRFLDDIRRGWNTWGMTILNEYLHAWLRPVVQISSSMRETTSPTGLPCGAISGLLAATQKRIVQWMYVIPRWIPEIHDAASKYYTTLRHCIARDVAFITTANPSSTIKLVEAGIDRPEGLIRDVADGTCTPPEPLPASLKHRLKLKKSPRVARRLQAMLDEHGQLLPRHYWNPAFLANWTGGTLGLYLPRLRELFGEHVPIHDIGLLASEGRFSLPSEPNSPAGVADVVGNVLEFIPAADREKDNPPTLRAHELAVGGEYFLVFSNWTGLMRYNLDDRVRVTGFDGQAPVYEFLSRGLRTTSLTGEKLTEHQVVAAMDRATANTPEAIERFTLSHALPARPTTSSAARPPRRGWTSRSTRPWAS